MTINIPVQTIECSGILRWYHWLVVVASLLLTLSAWYITSKQVRQRTELQFNYQAEQQVALVRERLSKYEDALWSGSAAIHAQTDGINEEKWRTFSEALSIDDKYPGINGIGVIYYIPPSERERFIASQRLLRSAFKIFPQHEQEEYWPIIYIEPIANNYKAVGLDMAFEYNRRTAAHKARDTGTSQITGPIILVQDEKRTPGFLLYVPYYKQITPPDDLNNRRQQFVGIVYAPFIMNNLMEGTLQNTNRLVNFNIMDGEEILYDELHQGSENFDSLPLLSKQVSVDMYGRDWSFTIQSSNLFRKQQTSNQPYTCNNRGQQAFAI
jgi:CHASE1-domain containing sensor protein